METRESAGAGGVTVQIGCLAALPASLLEPPRMLPGNIHGEQPSLSFCPRAVSYRCRRSATTIS